jgi:hypothetical protein
MTKANIAPDGNAEREARTPAQPNRREGPREGGILSGRASRFVLLGSSASGRWVSAVSERRIQSATDAAQPAPPFSSWLRQAMIWPGRGFVRLQRTGLRTPSTA